MKKVFVTGCGGFVGSNLIEALLKMDEVESIVGMDNYSTGSPRNITGLTCDRFQNQFADITVDANMIAKLMEGCDTVFHFAANADIRGGILNTGVDLKQNITATRNVLEAMKMVGARTILFTSTGPVYGDSKMVPTPEYGPIGVQTSLYAASKLACEGYISSYCNYYGMSSYIFRMVSLHGPKYSHGFAIDFFRKLRNNPNRLEVLGDGTIKKSYMHVQDAIRAMLHVLSKDLASKHEYRTAIYNLGLPEYIDVATSASVVAQFMGLKPEILYQQQKAGWAGDHNVYLDTTKIRLTGWRPFYDLAGSIKSTIEYLMQREAEENKLYPNYNNLV